MYKAVQAIGIENRSSVAAFQRPFKPLRTAGQGNNNLTAFRQLQSDKRTRMLAAISSEKGNDQTENSSTRHLQEFNKPANGKSGNKVFSSDGSGIFRNTTSTENVHRNKIEAIAFAAVVTGAVVAGTWAATGQREQQGDTEHSRLSPTLAAQQKSDKKFAQVPKITLPYISSSTATDLYHIKNDLDITSELTREYAEEVVQLRALNTSLRSQVDSLDNETIDLNTSLLQLESALSATESAPKGPMGIRTVYNFVDIPLGSSPGNVNGELSGNSAPASENGVNRQP